MKKNLLFFTLILSGLSTHVFAAADEEPTQEAPKKQSNYMTSTESSESKKDSKRTSSKQENFKFAGKSTYQEGPLDPVEKSEYKLKKYDTLNYREPTESSESKKDSKRTSSKQENFKFAGKSTYQEGPLDPVEKSEYKLKKYDTLNYREPTESSESKKDSKRTSSKQENFKFAGKSTYKEGPLDPVEKSEYKLKKYDALNYREPTKSSESKKDSTRTLSKQENFKFGGKSTYKEGPLDTVEETPRQKQLKDKVGTRFGKNSNAQKTAPSDATSNTSETSDSEPF